jgi:hypothetical protein
MQNENELRARFAVLQVGMIVTVFRSYSFRTGTVTRVREFPYFYVNGRATTVYSLRQNLPEVKPAPRSYWRQLNPAGVPRYDVWACSACAVALGIITALCVIYG